MMLGFNISQSTPSLKKIAEGRQAAARIFEIIDRVPKIKNPANPIRPTGFKGVIKFENVTFSYPKEPTKKILENFSVEFNNHSSALVGESGCGKSTIFQLLMRFYDPDEGRITMDDVDLRDLDLVWLRENIGYVGQEPVLFATSIRENLSFGKEDATEEEINEALKKAEAYEFVQTLENKLETYVGTGGGQLSGGQKQRIAIARALLRNPKLLLLDEATSALDRKNERLIQETLDKIAQQKTTITIAHRTKTIMHCNMIYVLKKGRVEEKGAFTQLERFKNVNFEE
jgi:ATP-binding cassette subfamily B (MDR/TAP) protein 1